MQVNFIFYASISLLIIGYNDCTSLNIPTSTEVINTCKAFRATSVHSKSRASFSKDNKLTANQTLKSLT